MHPRTPDASARIWSSFLGVCRMVNGLRSAAAGRDRRAARRLQHGALQREAAASLRHERADARPLRGARLGAAPGRRRRRACAKKLADIKAYADYGSVPPPSLVKMAKLGVVIDDWMDENDLVATAHPVLDLAAAQLRRQRLHADEHDERAADALRLRGGHHRRRLDVRAATGVAARPARWWTGTTTTADDPNKCVLFHCGNWAKSFIPDAAIKTAPILGTTLGEENTYGAMAGRTPAGPVTFARVSTDDASGAHPHLRGRGRLHR